MKRKICLLLVLSMILSMTVSISVFGEKNSSNNFIKIRKYENQFADVMSSEWFAYSVSQAYEYGLVSGNSETSFNPSGNVSIAESIVLACRLNNIYCDNGENFENGEIWYQPYVDYAIKNKIIDREYTNYDVSATRKEFATILSNSLPKEIFTEINKITVIPDVSNSEENIYMLYNAGILSGNDKYGTFNPTSNIQRSEVAAIIVRIADKNQRKKFVLEEKPVEVEKILLSQNTINMVEGDKITLSAEILPDKANDKTITWKSSNTSIATVKDGVVSAKKEGNAIISAVSTNGVSAICNVFIQGIPWYNDNMYRVGKDIPAGDYYAVVTDSKYGGYYCKYENSLQEDIEDNDNFDTFTFFRCYDGQYLKLSRCKITPIENAPTYTSNNGVYGEGTYRVGIDIPEGEYKFTPTESEYSGYYCAYTDITYEDIEDNDIFDGTAYYTVYNGQYLKISRASAIRVGNASPKDNEYHGEEYSSDDEDTYNSKDLEYLVSYIQKNGTSDKGYKQITTTTKLDSISSKAAITYRHDINSLIFYCKISSSSMGIVVNFDYDIEDESVENILVSGVSSTVPLITFTNKAKIDISRYTNSKTLDFEEVTEPRGIISNDSYELSNTAIGVAMDSWEVLLSKKVGMSLKKIGFDKY